MRIERDDNVVRLIVNSAVSMSCGLDCYGTDGICLDAGRLFVWLYWDRNGTMLRLVIRVGNRLKFQTALGKICGFALDRLGESTWLTLSTPELKLSTGWREQPND